MSSWNLIPSPFLLFVVISLLTVFPSQSQTGDVNVRVTTTAREELIDQAEVRLLGFAAGSPSQRAFTDGGGRVAFRAVRRGRYYVEVEKPGFVTVREAVDVNGGGQEYVAIMLKPVVSNRASEPARAVSSRMLAAPPIARREYEQGVAKLKDSPRESVEHFRKAIKEYPDFAEAYTMLGLAYMQLKEGLEAAAVLKKAIQIDSKLASAHMLLGKIYLDAKEFEVAEKLLLRSITLDPSAWDAHYEIARCYFNLRRLDDALRHAEIAHGETAPASAVHLLLVDIYLKRGEKQKALSELEEFSKADPKSPFMPRVRELINTLRKEKSD